MCALAIEDCHLLKPQKLGRLDALGEPNLRAGRATVSGRAGEPDAKPVLRRQIVAIHLHEPLVVERTGVTNDVESAVAVDVAKAKAVVHRSGGLVFDPPRFVHVSEAAAAGAAQHP